MEPFADTKCAACGPVLASATACSHPPGAGSVSDTSVMETKTLSTAAPEAIPAAGKKPSLASALPAPELVKELPQGDLKHYEKAAEEEAHAWAADAEHAATEATQAVKQSVSKARKTAREALADGERYVREHPQQAALAGLGLGMVLAQVPLRLLVTGLVSLFLVLLKPLALFYAITNLLRDSRSAKASHGAAKEPSAQQEMSFEKGLAGGVN